SRALHYVAPARLLQVRDEDGPGLAAEAVDSVRKQSAQVTGAIIELSYSDRAARAVICTTRRHRLFGGHRLMRFGGAATHEEACDDGCDRIRAHTVGKSGFG